MPLQTESPLMVFSGPIDQRSQCAQALVVAGFTILPNEVQDEAGSWGLPSHTDPVTAHAAGAPNAGHQIDQPHPSTLTGPDGEIEHDCDHVGQPYEADPSIGWLSAYGEDVDLASRAAQSAHWALRLHTSPSEDSKGGVLL